MSLRYGSLMRCWLWGGQVLCQEEAGIMNKKSMSIVKSQIVPKGKYVEVEIDKKVIKIVTLPG